MEFFVISERHLEECLSLVSCNIKQSGATHDNYKADLIEGSAAKLIEAKETLKELQRQVLLIPPDEKLQAQKRFYEHERRIRALEDAVSDAQKRQSLIDGVLRMQDASTDTALAHATQATSEALEIGADTLSTISMQNDQMGNTLDNLHRTMGVVEGTQGIVTKMRRVQAYNNCMHWAVVILLLIAIGTFIYLYV